MARFLTLSTAAAVLFAVATTASSTLANAEEGTATSPGQPRKRRGASPQLQEVGGNKHGAGPIRGRKPFPSTPPRPTGGIDGRMAGGAPTGDDREPQNIIRKGPFNPKPSAKLEARRAEREARRRRHEEVLQMDRKAAMRKHLEEMKSKGIHTEEMLQAYEKSKNGENSEGQDTPGATRERLIEDPAQRESLANAFAAQQARRNIPYDHRTANPRNHYFAAMMNIPHPGPNATTAELDAYTQKTGRLRNQYMNSHPRNVIPDAPNFGLRYRTTHLATMGFAVLPEEGLGPNDGGEKEAVELGNVTIALFGKAVPNTVDNFVGLCKAAKGFGYVGSEIHRILPKFVIQGGDIEASSDGLGGYTMHADYTEDDLAEIQAIRGAAEGGELHSESRSIGLDNPSDVENKEIGAVANGGGSKSLSESKSKSLSASKRLSSSHPLKKAHDRRSHNRYMNHENYLVPHGAGTISMAASHRSKVGSQFYFALDDKSGAELNKRFVVFGHVVFGYRSTLAAMQMMRIDNDDRPVRPIVMTHCEAVPYSVEAEDQLAKEGLRSRRLRMLRDDHYTPEQITGYASEAITLRENDEKLEKEDKERERLRTAALSKSLPPVPGAVADPEERDEAVIRQTVERLLAKGPQPHLWMQKTVEDHRHGKKNNKGGGRLDRRERLDRLRDRREGLRKARDARVKKERDLPTDFL